MDIAGKRIILTGASSGIGLELLKRLSEYGNVQIIAVARHIEPIPVKEGIIIPYSADLSNQEEIDRLFVFAKSIFRNIDIFIANAGFAYLEKIEIPDWKHIEHIFALNTISPIYSLSKQIEFNGKSSKSFFVCTSSAVSSVPLPYYSLYCSTKAAIRQFVHTYQYEKSSNVHTLTVYPVATRTPFFEKANGDKEPPLPFPTQSVETIAKAIIRGIEQEKKSVYPSFLFRIFNYFGHIFPFIFTTYSYLEKRKIECCGIL